MVWDVKNFWNKQTSNGFGKRKWDINLNWRPKKGISLINQKLKDMWYEPVTKTQIEENYMQLIQMTPQELDAIVGTPESPVNDCPALVSVIVDTLKSWRGFDVLEKMLDRVLWKSVQKTEDVTPPKKEPTKEELELLDKIL